MHLKISLAVFAIAGMSMAHGAAAQIAPDVPQHPSDGAAASTQATVEALLRSKTCLGCHQVDSSRVGPPFTAVAQRYGSQPGAEDYLAQSIRSGGRYRWGKLSMAAQPQVSPDEAHQIAAWILSLDHPK